VLPLVAVSQVLGLHLMNPLRMDGRFALIVALGCVATLGPAVVLAPALARPAWRARGSSARRRWSWRV